MTNKDNSDIFVILGGIAVAVAGILGINYLANNKQNNHNQISGEIPKKSCNKCPFS